jgi:peptidoglycan/xylan/chitin deacetylase (PgdA/CDA1 family)
MGTGEPADDRPPVLLTVDLEDWHQLVGRAAGLPDWDRPHDEFERQAKETLGLMRSLGAHATFFVLGMTAQHHARVVERIASDGHEIACHGFAHMPVWQQATGEFRRDLEGALASLARIGARAPRGYRAPGFSLTSRATWAFDVLSEFGFGYDSSHYDSVKIPDRLPPARPLTGSICHRDAASGSCRLPSRSSQDAHCRWEVVATGASCRNVLSSAASNSSPSKDAFPFSTSTPTNSPANRSA